MTMTDQRRRWLRGAYLDRITEVAMHYAADHTHFVDSEWQAYIDGEFDYLSELSSADHAYLREQAGLEAFRRIVSALSATREAAFGKLRSNNTDVISPDARFAMDIGWIDLLQHAADRVRTYPESWSVKVVGGKEKFGCCVVHVTCDYSARGCRSEVERQREEIRLRSLSTCEICGSPGRLRLSGFAKTVCDQHSGVMGEFREDDGKWSDPWKWNEERPLEDYIDHVLDFGRALIAEVEHQKRPSCDESTDPIRSTPLGRRVDDDTWSKSGREREMLIEFGFQIIDAVNGACVKVEYLDGYVHDEVAGWREFAVQPLTPADEEFLQGYLRALIEEEYERIKNNR
ncbi:hypothetical protein [Sinorhizobium meliloti]|uniref:hypothetical protein n=1 Tax=Rhizobium meliloti TaxID=382 RepID=UPI000FE11D2B|nr:hypothetical protein [Sinorhizobium meliloti]RVG70867.1 hypothetical protein CN222_01655 [Sinorhizobium meliloti]